MKLKVGDRVMYSRDFLCSTGVFTGPIPFLKGTVMGTRKTARYPDLLLVQWDNQPGRSLVQAKNLVRADRLHLESR